MTTSERMKQFWKEVKAGERPAPKRGENSGIVRRKVRCGSSWLRRGQVILSVYPHGELGFREPAHRAEYRISLAEAFRQAVLLTTNKINARVKELRKQGFGLGEARRKARREVL